MPKAPNPKLSRFPLGLPTGPRGRQPLQTASPAMRGKRRLARAAHQGLALLGEPRLSALECRVARVIEAEQRVRRAAPAAALPWPVPCCPGHYAKSHGCLDIAWAGARQDGVLCASTALPPPPPDRQPVDRRPSMPTAAHSARLRVPACSMPRGGCCGTASAAQPQPSAAQPQPSAALAPRPTSPAAQPPPPLVAAALA